ncbi:ABC transporter permease [Mycolicibacterium sp.]|uniref:ABC transporter permease n=1 Tax=Mycolicibacterium sp. TaxID=2320850 RepID=UPI003D12223C
MSTLEGTDPLAAEAVAAGRKTRVKPLSVLVALALILAAWQVVAWLSAGWVPGIPAIAEAVVRLLSRSSTYSDLGITLVRLVIAFVAATVLGIAIGAAMGLWRPFEAFARPLVVVGLAIPDPMYFIFAVLLLGTDQEVGMLALVLAVIPFVVHGADSGVRNRDRNLDEMSRVYKLSRRSYFVDVLGRQIAPIALASMRTSLAFSWKIVVLMEALTQPNGIGSQIYYSFRLLRPAEMIAYALIFVVIMRTVEYLAFKPLERRLAGWVGAR